MNYKSLIAAVLPACLALLVAVPGASGQAASSPERGLVGGATRESDSGKPVAGVQIVAHSVAKGTDQATFTDADGIFTFTNLEPGQYEVAALKHGYEKVAPQVELAPRRVTRVELPLAAAHASSQATTVTT